MEKAQLDSCSDESYQSESSEEIIVQLGQNCSAAQLIGSTITENQIVGDFGVVEMHLKEGDELILYDGGLSLTKKIYRGCIVRSNKRKYGKKNVNAEEEEEKSSELMFNSSNEEAVVANKSRRIKKDYGEIYKKEVEILRELEDEKLMVYNMSIHLYIDHLSQPCRAVFALCLLKAVPLTLHETRVGKREHLTEEFKSVNPFQKVPAIHDQTNLLKLAESHAIMKYICRIYPLKHPQLYPNENLRTTAKIDEYLDYHHCQTRKLAMYISTTVFAKRLNMYNSAPRQLKIKQEHVQKVMKQIDEIWLDGQKRFIVGDQVTIADLSAYHEIKFLSLCGYHFQKWNKIPQWMAQIEQIKEVEAANIKFSPLVSKIIDKDFSF